MVFLFFKQMNVSNISFDVCICRFSIETKPIYTNMNCNNSSSSSVCMENKRSAGRSSNMKLVSFFFFFCPLFLISLWFSTWNLYLCLGIFWNLESKWFNTSSIRIVFFQHFFLFYLLCFLFFFRNIIALMEYKGRDDQDEGNNFVVLVWTTKLKKKQK